MDRSTVEKGREYFRRLPAAVHAGRAVAMASLCTANPWVVEAVMACRGEDPSPPFLVEATANQVHPDGGYSGMDPAGFVRVAASAARRFGPGGAPFLLGGDHLGPYPWRHLDAETAMEKAAFLVRDCVVAGMVKLHLDASRPCAGDPAGPHGLLPPDIAAERSARLAAAAETAWRGLPEPVAPLYVIGTEVPAPGGAGARPGHGMTSPDALDEAVHLTREGFASYGIAHAWERVVAVVVDAGVGFSNLAVADYRPDLAAGLVRRLRNHPGLVFEAHATDYQRPEGLRRMVEDGFSVLKVGPELTFRFREAVFALALLERELLRGKKSSAPSRLGSVLDREMVDDPRHWRAYYRCAGEPEHLLRRYALTDRCRYYWSRPAVTAALARLFDNLRRRAIPLPLLSQYLPDLVEAVRSGAVEPSPESLVRARIQGAWRRYLSACYTDPVLPPGPPPGR